jgi:hypothetical protein
MRIHTDVITREDLLRATAAAITAEDGYVFLHAKEPVAVARFRGRVGG